MSLAKLARWAHGMKAHTKRTSVMKDMFSYSLSAHLIRGDVLV